MKILQIIYVFRVIINAKRVLLVQIIVLLVGLIQY